MEHSSRCVGTMSIWRRPRSARLRITQLCFPTKTNGHPSYTNLKVWRGNECCRARFADEEGASPCKCSQIQPSRTALGYHSRSPRDPGLRLEGNRVQSSPLRLAGMVSTSVRRLDTWPPIALELQARQRRFTARSFTHRGEKRHFCNFSVQPVCANCMSPRGFLPTRDRST
jgi:hypothetical protein